MQRINVVGTSGSGKTTVARRIAEALRFPHVELDALHWEPGWEEAPIDVFRERVSESTRGSQWVVDGNYGKVRDIVWGRADTVVWLDYGFPRIFLRLLWRTLRRGVLRERLWNDNRESLTLALSKDSILLWAIKSYPKNKEEYPKWMSSLEYAHIRFLRQDSPRETEAWLKSLGSGSD
ncbi:adenylate kinase [Candidatus Bathyarchaeota archaeon]|nr:adenylate kinase [Candidatus Bathyarchaeota archaeon]MBL7078965.1 adenylate kinase [Candidatus Bathyarchaeota archaeon]